MKELFIKNWELASGEFVETRSPQEIYSAILRLIKKENLKTALLAKDTLDSTTISELKNECAIITDFADQSSDDVSLTELEKADCGISAVDALIADTGSLVVSSRNKGDRIVSSLPPVHIALAVDAPVFPDLSSFLARANPDRSFTIITGPSRTADIEKKLVLGAHGPLRVIVLL